MQKHPRSFLGQQNTGRFWNPELPAIWARDISEYGKEQTPVLADRFIHMTTPPGGHPFCSQPNANQGILVTIHDFFMFSIRCEPKSKKPAESCTKSDVGCHKLLWGKRTPISEYSKQPWVFTFAQDRPIARTTSGPKGLAYRERLPC